MITIKKYLVWLKGKHLKMIAAIAALGVWNYVRFNLCAMTDYDEQDARAFADLSGFGGCTLWLGVFVALAITVGVLWWFNS